MTAKELNTKLLSCLPEIEKEYKDCVSWQDGDDTGSHVVFSCVLVPYIIKCANQQDIPKLKKCLQFLEMILSGKDLYSEEVIAFSVFENLMFSEELIANVYIYLGTESKKVYDEVKNALERYK